jgi:hypothetical protein
VKKQYFFGYLFVGSAKLFALLVMAAGIGFCLLQYSQAKTVAAAAVYQPSPNVQQVLRKLREVFSGTGEIVASFGKDDQSSAPSAEPPNFPAVIDSDADFARVSNELFRIDQERQRLKQSLVSRFETSVASIEEKLRTYAASLEPSRSTAAPETAPSPAIAAVLAAPPPPQSQSGLFSPTLGASDLKNRSASLAQRKEFLKFLESKAENAENRAILNQAANEMDQLSRLLPEKIETQNAAQPSASVSPVKTSLPEEERTTLLSERVAGQLEQLRNEVRQTLLTSWKLDDVLDQASELTSVEREKCRIATLAQKGIWLSAESKILPGLLAAVLLSFLILVFADLVRTFLDTAAHTGTVADAINALRGSVLTAAPAPAPPPTTARDFEIVDRKFETIDEEIPVEGGS